MNTSADSPVTASDAPSLTGIRIAAAIGLLVAIALVVVGFLGAWWLGLIAFAALPVIPMLSVLALEAVQRSPWSS